MPGLWTSCSTAEAGHHWNVHVVPMTKDSINFEVLLFAKHVTVQFSLCFTLRPDKAQLGILNIVSKNIQIS